MFIADVVEEHARVLHEAERRMKKEELLDDSSSGPFNAAKFAAHGPQVCPMPSVLSKYTHPLVPFSQTNRWFSRGEHSLPFLLPSHSAKNANCVCAR